MIDWDCQGLQWQGKSFPSTESASVKCKDNGKDDGYGISKLWVIYLFFRQF
jgi:hypothetical protein